MGRPVKYETPEQMQEVIDRYFNDCKLNRIGLAMEPPTYPEGTTTDDAYPTVTGLALMLGMTREGLIHYEEKNEFADTIKKAKSKVEAFLEQRLYHQAPTGVIFNLKNNYGWRDKSEIDLESPNGSMSPKSLDASQLSTEALQEILKAKDATNQ